jgi:putative transposase
MPRLPRSFVPGVPLHVIQRGNNRHPCFFAERDYIIYLEKLAAYSRAGHVAIHSFVLMTNHVHLLLTPTDASGPSRVLQDLGRYYVRYINSEYSRTGTLWEGRFKASMVDSERYFLTVSRYVELNPVRAHMVRHPAEYPWSSYRGNALGKSIGLLTPHPVYLALGVSDEKRREAYQELFAKDLPDLTVDEIRAATNKAWVLGDTRFKQLIEKQLGYALPPHPRGGDRKSTKRNADEIKLL